MPAHQSVETPIGFADGKVVRIEKLGMKVLVAVQAWNESKIEAEFEEVIGIRESMATELSDFVVTTVRDEFTTWCTQRAYESEIDGGESIYQFLDAEGLPCIEIVAKRVFIRSNQP